MSRIIVGLCRSLLLTHSVLVNLSRSLKMPTPSIKMFFKPKQQPLKNVSPQGDKTPLKEDKNNSPTSASHIQSKQQPTDNGTPKKRAADEDENSPETGTIKRQAIISPLKMDSNKHATTNQAEPSVAVTLTPTKVKQTGEDISKPILPTTPLIDLNLVIRKKISNGAFALHENIGHSWFRALQNEFDKPYFRNLSNFLKQERSTKTVYPPENKVYAWTHHHDIKSTRVIILGQDPYHGPGQAHGLSFSVMRGVRIPPSLVNIFKELEKDIDGFVSPSCGDLTGWAKQGVLMLNTCLSVNQGQANSHQNKGWETFTDAVINYISKHSKNKVVFLLWGRPAQRKVPMIDKRHKILTSAHPSPLSAHNGFFGCSHFSQTNKFLREQNLPEIDWKAL